MSSRYLIIIGVLLAFVACKPGTPKQFIQPGEMEDILVDYHLAKAMAYNSDGNPDYNLALYKVAVLEKHGVSEADFDSSLVYYYTRADRFEPIYKRVAERLEEQAVNLGANEGEIAKYSMLTANGDTADIWTQREAVLLMPNPPYNRLDFDFVADTTYRKGDSFLFQFMTDYVFQDGAREAVALVSVTYDNDSVVTRNINVATSGHNQLRVEPIDSCGIRRVRGFIYLGGGNNLSTTVRMLFVNHLQLIRFHQQKKTEIPTNNGEINQKDSLERDSNARRNLSDTISRRDTVRRGVQPVPAEAGNAQHRVVGRAHSVKLQP